VKPEADYIQESLNQLNEALSRIPEQYAKIQREADRQIDLLCEEAGIMGRVKAIRDAKETNQKRLQSQADSIQGRMHVLKDIHEKYHVAPIPDGMTHMYGIRLESLDPMSRLKLMNGKLEDEGWAEMIQVLGGDHTRRDWDGTEPTPPALERTSRPAPPEERDIREPLPELNTPGLVYASEPPKETAQSTEDDLFNFIAGD
jgi:hypothetical protein